ncbi:MAG TPA: VOC family protein [Reyranella sp.]|nr:VOC family protein [Reyranella sp.]
MGRWLCTLLLLLGSPAVAQIQGLDHIPIVVRDLDRSAADFASLGFALKAGRPHANGLRNVHAKFRDGTELELISPDTPTDELSQRYVEWLKQGDGPVSLGLFAPNIAPPAIEGVFFDKRQKSPTDRPEHFAHPNGATTLAAVWLAGSPVERQLVDVVGRWPVDQPVCAPFGKVARVLRLPEGEIVLLPRLSNRPIVGATVAVASLDPVRRFVTRSAVDCPRSVWVETHGLWLELRVH